MNKGHSKRRYVIALAVIGGGVVLLVCAVVVLALRSGRRETPLPPVPEVTSTPSEVRVKPVVRKDAARKPAVAASTSRAVAVVCGADEATADRYEARNDALRSIARRRDLPKERRVDRLAGSIFQNLAAGEGVQIGVCNYARGGWSGLQIGLVNYIEDSWILPPVNWRF